MTHEYQPKTGQPCSCRPGIARDNCPACEGTGQRINFAAIRARRVRHDAENHGQAPEIVPVASQRNL